MRIIRVAVVAIAFIVIDALPVQAKDNPVAEWAIIPYVGVARNSPVGSAWGVASDRHHLFLSVQLETGLLRLAMFHFVYAPNVTPFVRITHTPTAASGIPREAPVTGYGFAPFGLALQLRIAERVAVFGAGAVGGLWFSRPVPVADARAFNVTVEWGGGLEVAIPAGGVVRLGYKFHHFSNVYTAPRNPGVDGNVFYAGWRWRVRLPR